MCVGLFCTSFSEPVNEHWPAVMVGFGRPYADVRKTAVFCTPLPSADYQKESFWCRQKVNMPYWSVPDSAYDDADEMAWWVKIGVEAAKRAGK